MILKTCIRPFAVTKGYFSTNTEMVKEDDIASNRVKEASHARGGVGDAGAEGVDGTGRRVAGGPASEIDAAALGPGRCGKNKKGNKDGSESTSCTLQTKYPPI